MHENITKACARRCWSSSLGPRHGYLPDVVEIQEEPGFSGHDSPLVGNIVSPHSLPADSLANHGMQGHVAWKVRSAFQSEFIEGSQQSGSVKWAFDSMILVSAAQREETARRHSGLHEHQIYTKSLLSAYARWISQNLPLELWGLSLRLPSPIGP